MESLCKLGSMEQI